MKILNGLFCFLGLAFCMACSSVNSRMEEKASTFRGWPVETQARVQNGIVQPGDTEEMVYVARGNPSEKYESSNPKTKKKIQVWKYLSRSGRTATETPSTLRGPEHTGFSGPYDYPVFGAIPVAPQPITHSTLVMKVEFEDGKVSRVIE